MFNRTSLQATAALASISLLAGCGLFAGDEAEAESKIVVGTTSSPTTLDPAAAWDSSWELYRNVFQTLLSFPTGSTTPQPDAADCRFTDGTSQVFQCDLREGLRFSSGTPVDAEAVKHSIERIRTINAEGGPSGLLGSLDKIETNGDRTVIFRLKESDATFPFVLATPATSIVDPVSYPADRVREDGKVVGSGPYLLSEYTEGVQARLVKNPTYKGYADRKNTAVTIRYFGESEALVAALKKKQIDVTYRGLTAEEVVDLSEKKAENEGLQVVELTGATIHYLVFNPKDPQAGKPAVRQAVAQVIDRGTLVSKAYKGTAEPLYSMVPKGIAGHTTKFFDHYGDPDVAKARSILRKAGIDEPVKLTIGYTTDRYGSSAVAEFTEIKRQLEASGLFEVTLVGKPWKDFQTAYQKGEYPVFGRGWFPDFPDPDNFVAPFVGKKNVHAAPYEQQEITDRLLPESRRKSDRATVVKQFERAQQIFVEDVRMLPLWQGKLYIAASEEIGGAERALDPQTVMQVWELHRKTSW
ncbi:MULTISPECIES: ABC transporter substrate-binding protein [Streptomyces]|uniref:ABC transporter substrate-binding protein n=1 Tax=Streptomyces sudanensis TaxID=436397 RepID=A0ABY4TGZ0_9ACTN|nr:MULTISPECIES: ABC transporter substrate-binding protein [Streptomyces]MCP9959813.1 ABC transporter substrate-binding protein [Streptomyces sudanensis]MCP9988847.1 ABC transporter substrate-binding protein [Streptomyces sudanensis]MCP9999778.1 ABC transporter substrate-binding protein [Streptomyces sudanensis]URN18141.1 ABC transporter substrate-binding protein [Streptomyces sudanensis]